MIEERIASLASKEGKEKALLAIKVCDPAAGSGHFLLAAARCIGTELAKVRLEEEQVTPGQFRSAVRDVIQHCIYGVDLNPLAVDLCKVALWIEGHHSGLPLTFLDHRIKCGNSLIGVDSLHRLKTGIPDDAFKPVTGDDKEVSKIVKARNRRERNDWESGQMKLQLLGNRLEDDIEKFVEDSKTMDAIVESDPSISERRRRYIWKCVPRKRGFTTGLLRIFGRQHFSTPSATRTIPLLQRMSNLWNSLKNLNPLIPS